MDVFALVLRGPKFREKPAIPSRNGTFAGIAMAGHGTEMPIRQAEDPLSPKFRANLRWFLARNFSRLFGFKSCRTDPQNDGDGPHFDAATCSNCDNNHRLGRVH